VHELGHAVGVPHHADEVVDRKIVAGPRNYKDVVLLPGPSCTDPRLGAASEVELPLYRDGIFIGCFATYIAARQATHSGDADCAMKYIGAEYYVAPGPELLSSGRAQFNEYGNPPIRLSGAVRDFPSVSGRVLAYQNDLDTPGLGQFCELKAGTGINALPGDANHAGDATAGNCRFRVVVNDVRP
jgi:hypothetical protein